MKLDWTNSRYILMAISVLTIAVIPLFNLSCNNDPNQLPVITPSPISLAPVDVQYTPLPSYIPEPESFVPVSDTVVIGQIVESSPQFQQGESVFRDWMIKIESYMVNPLPLDSLKVRILEQSGIMPVKGVHLRQGEHLVLFLKVEDDHYLISGGLMGAKFIIDGDRVSYSMIGNSPWEPLAEVISRIKMVADTWANEKLTSERRSQISNIAIGDPGIKEFLAGKDFEIGQITPYVSEDTLKEIHYIVSIDIPKQNQTDLQLAVTVNATQKKVDNIQVNLGYTAYSDEVKIKIQQIALSDPIVQELIGDRGYKIADIVRDSWQENIEGKTVINIFPKVEIWLQPAISNILNVFVDLKGERVVKIFNESHLSPSLLESSGSDRDFTLTVNIPKTTYRVGEIAEAILTLSYNGDQSVELSSTSGQYFDLLIRDDQNNIIYQWERYNAGLPTYFPAPTEPIQPPPPLNMIPEHPFKETINPGQSITHRLEFSLPKAGTYYFCGRNFGGWDFGDVLADYPNGTGYGLYIEAPFIVIDAR